jgi:hypothetical protein
VIRIGSEFGSQLGGRLLQLGDAGIDAVFEPDRG